MQHDVVCKMLGKHTLIHYMHMGLLVFYYSLILFVFSHFAKGFGHFNFPYRPHLPRSASDALRPTVRFRQPRGTAYAYFTVVHRAIPPPYICFYLLPTIRHRFGQI